MNTDERARLTALRRYRILDTEPERAFDDLTLLASRSAARRSPCSPSWTPIGSGSSRASASRPQRPSAASRSALTRFSSRTSSWSGRAQRCAVPGEPVRRLPAAHPVLRGRTARHAGRLRARHAVRGGQRAAHAERRAAGRARGAQAAGVGPSSNSAGTCSISARRWKSATAPRRGRRGSSAS